MKYFLDTEFIERSGSIQLISIGIVDEDGREFYALCKDFDLKATWKDEWLRDNVLLPIYLDKVHGDMRNHVGFSRGNVGNVIKFFGFTGKEIASKVIEFICPYATASEYAGNDSIAVGVTNYLKENPPEFYGYYADYDWVVFCWLFGRMIDLPEGFPMYCRDLKQSMAERGLGSEWKNEHCPDPQGEHNALVDARWNKDLYREIVNWQLSEYPSLLP